MKCIHRQTVVSNSFIFRFVDDFVTLSDFFLVEESLDAENQ
jgi:hypothetical protein